jgi:hypothetical protein
MVINKKKTNRGHYQDEINVTNCVKQFNLTTYKFLRIGENSTLLVPEIKDGYRRQSFIWYQEITKLTDRMLALTHTRQSDDFPKLQTQCADMLEQPKEIEPLHALSAEQSGQECRLLYVINPSQYRISSFIQPKLNGLGAGLGSLKLQQRLH